MGRLPVIVDLLRTVLSGHELPVAILASQGISNVPAAILLSGFTKNYLPLLCRREHRRAGHAYRFPGQPDFL